MTISGKAAISGFAEMSPVKGAGDVTALGIIANVAHDAIADAGLNKSQVDGLLTGWAFSDYSVLFPSVVADYLQLRPQYLDQVELGGASAAGMVWRAAAAIHAGLCHTVLCVLGDRRSRPRQAPPFPSIDAEFDAPYGLIAANPGYALIAQRHKHEYGTTAQQMSKVAVDQRRSACKNPAALFGSHEIEIDDVLNSRMIVDPLHLLEIVSPCTGGGAFIVTAIDRAKDGPNTPVILLGAGEAGGHSSITHARNLTTSLVEPASRTAFGMADVKPQDMDFVQPYDCYTITVIITLEDAGFCEKGEGGHFVEQHDLSYDGDFPCNTHGGQLSFGQPGLAGGMSHVIEGARQLMGRAEKRQVPDARIGYVNGNGGIMAEQCSLILST